jgi:chromosome segregation protein
MIIEIFNHSSFILNQAGAHSLLTIKDKGLRIFRVMHLKSLELSGFKSFAKKTELSFNTPITAIVGPNGSGKSNVAEGFRFVLGEQSIKSMRGKRTEDLIWNGSPEMARANRASVKLVFDNSPRHLPGMSGGGARRLLNLDFDEVSIERVIYRDSSSEYLLNGTQVRLRDIVEVLASAHIGASGHHIISQGEADRILNANPRERREMVEDALGLKIYQWKREESEHKLEKTEENMKQVESLRREIAPHLTYLKKQVEKIEKTKALKVELLSLYGEYLRREHAFLTVGKKTIAQERHAPVAELKELGEKLASAKRMLQETGEKDGKAREILSIEKTLTTLRKEREALSREVGRLEGEISGAERLAKIQGTAKDDNVVIPLSEVEGLVKQIDAVSVDEEEQEVGILLATIGRIKEVMHAFLERHRAKKAPAAETLTKEIATLREKKANVEMELIDVEAREAKANDEERLLRAEVEKEKDSSRDAEKDVFRIMARQSELHGILNTLRVRESELDHAEADFKRELTEGALLVGRGVLEYQNAKVKMQNGEDVTPGALIAEERSSQEERRRKIERLKIRIEEAGGGSGAETLKEYEEATERDAFLVRELADLEKSAEGLRELIAELVAKLDAEFRNGIGKINTEFQSFFVILFGGGTAKLSVAFPQKKEKRRDADELLGDDAAAVEAIAEKEEEENEAGIDIEVSLPRKKIKGLMMLSGGERALTSIALLFAMSQVKPPPFIILDETDAALDEANSKKYGDMVENLSKHSQLILITHNRETMSRAGVIYGVTMDKSGVSKLLSIAFDEAVAVAK